MPTPHIEAKLEDIAKTVIMPGDPLRAKYIAEKYLTDVKQVNSIRNMLGFTGKYKGKPVTVFGSGMGIPSMGIYSYELFKFYDVDNIIRIGTAGGIDASLELRDLILALGTSPDSNYANQFAPEFDYAATADFSLCEAIVENAKKLNRKIKVGNIMTSEAFYARDGGPIESMRRMGILAVEMETFALYVNAALLRKRAASILMISDKVGKKDSMPPEDRQKRVDEMAELALETATSL